MILRKATLSKFDCQFIADCYESWPDSKRGPVYPQDVRTWIKLYDRSPNEQGFIGELYGRPVGFVLVFQNMVVAKVCELVVLEQGKGHGSGMWRALQKQLADDGVVVAQFDALPGVMADLVRKGRFKEIGAGVGEETGLETITAQVTYDMEI